jgi:catechol 2,3-dioxygenase-like lactoylglutathione lyase family enzyme
MSDHPEFDPLRPLRIGYAAIGVPDVSALSTTLQTYFSLACDDRDPGRHVLRGATDHQWVVIEPAPELTLNRLGFELQRDEDLERFERHLTSRGIDVKTGSDWDHGVGRYLRFDDPDGNHLELFTQMIQLPVPVPTRTINTHKLLHAVLLVPDMAASVAFYTEVLGFRVSDWVEDSAAFMRVADRYHHSLALITSSGARRLDHLCFLMDGLDDVMRLRARSLLAGLESRADVKRHAPSGSISYYIIEPTSELVLEACWDHLRIANEASHRARVLPRRPDTPDMWLAGDDGSPITNALVGPLASP